MFELAVLVLLLVIVAWIYSIDQKKEEAPVFNINLSIDGLDNPQTGNRQQTTSIKEKVKSSKKINEVPIETSNSSKSWKDIKITDSYNG